MDITTSLTTVTLTQEEVEILEKTERLMQIIGNLAHKNNVEVVDKNSNDMAELIDSIFGGACMILEHYKIDEEG